MRPLASVRGSSIAFEPLRTSTVAFATGLLFPSRTTSVNTPSQHASCSITTVLVTGSQFSLMAKVNSRSVQPVLITSTPYSPRQRSVNTTTPLESVKLLCRMAPPFQIRTCAPRMGCP